MRAAISLGAPDAATLRHREAEPKRSTPRDLWSMRSPGLPRLRRAMTRGDTEAVKRVPYDEGGTEPKGSAVYSRYCWKNFKSSAESASSGGGMTTPAVRMERAASRQAARSLAPAAASIFSMVAGSGFGAGAGVAGGGGFFASAFALACGFVAGLPEGLADGLLVCLPGAGPLPVSLTAPLRPEDF